jgi:hypothetical protein
MPSLSLVALQGRPPEAQAVTPESLYVWQVYESGMWGTIAVVVAELSSPGNFLQVSEAMPIPLTTRNLNLATSIFRANALDHHNRTGLPVRLVRMEPVETMELFPDAEG